MRGGAPVERRIGDQEVAGSIPVGARLRNDSGQVVHTRLPRRRQSLLYGVVEPGTFTFYEELRTHRETVSIRRQTSRRRWRLAVSRVQIHLRDGSILRGFRLALQVSSSW